MILGEDLRLIFPSCNFVIIDESNQNIPNAQIDIKKYYEYIDYIKYSRILNNIKQVRIEVIIKEVITVESLGEVYQDSITIDEDINISDNNAEENAFNGSNKCENVHLNVQSDIDSSTNVQEENVDSFKHEYESVWNGEEKPNEQL